jgi:hypothetical protein
LVWDRAEVSSDRLAIVLKVRGGELRLPLRGQPPPDAVQAAAAFLNAFSDGEAQPDAGGADVHDAFFEEFALVEASQGRVVATATEGVGIPLSLALGAWLVATGIAVACASLGLAAVIVGAILAVAPVAAWIVPVRRLAFVRDEGLYVDDQGPSRFEVEVTKLAGGEAAYVDVVRESQFFRLTTRAWKTERLQACAEFLRSFAEPGLVLEAPAAVDATDAAKEGGQWPLAFTSELRLRYQPLERSAVVLSAAVISAFPLAVAAFGWLMAIVAVGTAVLGVVARSLLSLARPTIAFDATTRHVAWQLRGVNLRFRWSSVESEGTGRGLVIQTEAGPLRVLLRGGRASERHLHRAIQAMERALPSPVDSAGTSGGEWPPGFVAALEFLDFDAVTTAELRLTASRLDLRVAMCLVVAGLALGFGVLSIEAPAAVTATIGLASVAWPFLFRPLRLTIARGSGSVLIRSWFRETHGPLTESLLHIRTLGSALTGQSFGLSMSIDDQTVALPGLTTHRALAEDARRALLGYSVGVGAASAGGAT